MKLIISLLGLFCFQVQANLIHISFNGDQFRNAETISKIFNISYNIPADLIRIHHSHDCLENYKSGLHLCLDEYAQLLLINSSNIELTKKSILSFSENLGENNAI